MPYPSPSDSSIHFSYLLRACMTASLGGLLFGYDTAVIAGTVEFLQIHFELSDIALGWTVSSALLGCIIGAWAAGWLSDRFGRKCTMLLCAVLFLVSAIWSGLAQSPGELALARIVGGVGVGAASLLTPVYISEIAPARIRGGLTTLNQISILVGMVVVYIVNSELATSGDETWRTSIAWRWMFASEALPAMLFLGLLCIVPESPRWLALHGRKTEALQILRAVGGTHDVNTTLQEITKESMGASLSWRDILRPPYRIVLVTGLCLAFLQQATGINIVMYYAPRIFTSAGVDTGTAVGHSIIIGVVMLIFTLVALFMADKLGRRPLLLLSALGMTVGLIALGWEFRDVQSPGQGRPILLWMLLYVAAFSIGMGPLVWTVIAEIFPNAMRGRAVGLCVLVLWLANYIVSQFFPYLLSRFGAYTFWIYAAFGVVSMFVIYFLVHETKGKSLEDITHDEIGYE